MRRAETILIAVLVLTLILTACGGDKKPTKGDLIVYVAAPLSGFQANGGQTVVGGARLKAAEVNAEGGLLGYRLVVRGVDDESDSDVAVSVAQEIAAAVRSGERVLGVIGHYNSGQTLAAMEVYKDLPIVVITPTASEVSLTQKGYRNFFRVNANNAVQARVGADYLTGQLGARRIAVLYNDDPYGIDLGKLVAQELRARGVEVVLSRQVAVEQNRFTEEVQAIAASGADGIFYAGYEVECPYLRYDLREAGLDHLPFLASDGCFLAATIDESDGAAEGMYVMSFAPQPSSVAGPDWIKAYQEVEYRNPDTYSVNGYTAMEVLVEGVKKAQSIEGPAVAEAIRSLQFDALIGPISYEPNGDLKDPRIYIFQVQRVGDVLEFVQVAP